jgi:putative flippase GtrA
MEAAVSSEALQHRTEIHPDHPPVVPLAQDPFLPKGPLQRLVNLFPGGQFLRYLLVGAFNTLFGYCSFLIVVKLLSAVIPARYLSLTAIAGSIISTPLNITVAYFGYKFFVFKTKGNYLLEWLKCFAVYGTGMIPGLVALGGLTRLLQGFLHSHAGTLRALLFATESHLAGAPRQILDNVAHGKTLAANLAGAIVIGFSTIYSFVGHKKVTFKTTSEASA